MILKKHFEMMEIKNIADRLVKASIAIVFMALVGDVIALKVKGGHGIDDTIAFWALMLIGALFISTWCVIRVLIVTSMKDDPDDF